MLFKNVAVMCPDISVRRNMYVGIEGDRIVYINEKEPHKDFGEIYSGENRLLMPGFVNSHAHSPMTLLRGYGENLALQDWLNTRIFPFEAQLDSNAVYWGTMLAMAESLKNGIVSSTDMYYFTDAAMKAVLESGAKNNFSRSITNFMDEDLFDMDSGIEMKEGFEKWNGAGGGRILIDMSLHAEYTTTPKTCDQLAEYTKQVGANMHIHVSETRTEHEECKERHGMTPAGYLASHGLFDTPTTAAHCVWIEDEDYEILKSRGVSVAVNPTSNMKLSSGICNVRKLLDKGINTTIGTDSVASNNALDMIQEMKMFALATKVSIGDPTAVTPADAIRAATVNGAKAQGRNDCGIIQEGCKADLILVDLSGPEMHPVHDIANNLVYSASGGNVCLTVVDGRVLYENGEFKTIDIEKTIAEAEKATAGILDKLK